MLDPRDIAQNPDAVKAGLRKRQVDDDVLAKVDAIIALRTRRTELVTEQSELRNERNVLSKEIGAMFKAGRRDEAEAAKAKVAAGKERIAAIEEELAQVETDERDLVMQIPNLPHEEVPEGASDEDNLLVRSWGEVPSFDFEPQAHVEVGEKLGIIDVDRSAKLAGSRFAVLRGAGARLERALIQFFLDMHVDQHGYTELMVPYIVHRQVLEGTGQLPKFEDDMFRLAGQLNGSDAFLIPTAEVPVTNLHREEILEEAQLPMWYCAFTPCFRAEAGSAGRDVRGLIRQHQFHKVEMVCLATPEGAEEAHQQMVGHAEACLQALGLPYRVMMLCGGDLGFGAHKCYDLEVWLPSQGQFREISSVSQCSDFQARRMMLRYRPESDGRKKSKARLVNTLNGSGLAVGRTLVAILENFQQEDGSVVIPEVLRPYMGGMETICI